jgi:hypothetical protein
MLWSLIDRFVNIGGIVDHQSLRFLFLIQLVMKRPTFKIGNRNSSLASVS